MLQKNNLQVFMLAGFVRLTQPSSRWSGSLAENTMNGMALTFYNRFSSSGFYIEPSNFHLLLTQTFRLPSFSLMLTL
jgi:hypothetical protein